MSPGLALPPFAIRARGNPCGVRLVPLDRPLVMGVVNCTPDSFSDGGRLADAAAAIAHGQALWRAGAEILDVGGEATNPRAQPVSAAVELDRVVPVVAGLAAGTDALISVDTTKAEVARAAIAAGADLVNDVSGGRFDPDILEVCAEAGVGYVLGHLRGRSLAEVFAAEVAPSLAEVGDELAERLAAAPAALANRIFVDPGLGFGKGADPAGNLALVAGAGALAARLGRPIVIGASRKRFVAATLTAAGVTVDADALDRASVGVSLAAIAAGAHVVRVHDVAGLRAALVGFCAAAPSFVATSRPAV